MDNDNLVKSKHGVNGQKSLLDIINRLKSLNYITDYITDYRVGYKEYDTDQFYFKYLIRFSDNTEWILNSTTSVRTDRLKAQQWDSHNIKRLNAYLEKAYVVLADGAEEKDIMAAKNYTDKIASHKMYSGIDGVITSSNFYDMAETKALSLVNDPGSAIAKAGLNFEKMLVDVICDQQNFRKWKYDDRLAVGYRYSLYRQVLKELGIESEFAESIYATTDIPKLPSGGNPKTDVCIIVKNKEEEDYYPISCKRSSANFVSVHEYSAEQFSAVLNPSDEKLKKYLLEFQKVGGIKKFGEKNSIILEHLLGRYRKKLTEWVVTGNYGEGEGIQNADYIIIYRDIVRKFSENIPKYVPTFRVYEASKYIDKISQLNYHFGTCFQWTYPSKKLGKKIQLKTKIF